MKKRETELAIVGGGPAGLATAIAARARGLEVDVFDGRCPPLDKACGEGLMPTGVAALAELGVDPAGLEARRFVGIRYRSGDLVADGAFPGGYGLGVRRPVLHEALCVRAAEVGARCHWGARVEGVEPAGVGCRLHVAGEEWRCRYLVGADGLHSRVRSWLGISFREASPRHRRDGVRRHFRVEPWSDRVEVFWGDRCEAYVTPVSEEEVGVAFLWSGRKASWSKLGSEFPQLLRRLEARAVTSADRGAGGLRQTVSRRTHGSAALVGDAAGYVDALTGEGLGLAFHQARALADRFATDDVPAYEADYRLLVRAPELLTRLTLLLSRHPALRRRVIGALSRDPRLFERLLGVQNGDIALWPKGALTFGSLLPRLLATAGG